MMKIVIIALAAVAIAISSPLSNSHNTRIVGGRDTPIEEAPWQAAVLFVGNLLCGGTILTAKYVATTAKCTKGVETWAFTVKAGTNQWNSDEGIEKYVAEIHINPYYVEYNHDGDLSIIELETPFELSAKIQPIALPTSLPEDGAIAITSGWGYTSFEGHLSKILQSVDVPIVNHKECEEIFNGRNPVTENMICAGYLGTGGKDSCEFDVGGPLSVNGVLVGISSWGVDCAHPKFPGVYTSIFPLLQFINRVIAK